MDKNLDQILSEDTDVIPSTQFVSNVMFAVHCEASIPAPTPFPWRRVMPGLAFCVTALTSLFIVAVSQCCKGFAGAGALPITFLKVVDIANRTELGWTLLALVAAFVPRKLLLARI